MLTVRGGIILIALGSLIVIAGIALYMMDVMGSLGLIVLGVLVEFAGGIIFLTQYRRNRSGKN
jgi:uncharacterized membrane protein